MRSWVVGRGDPDAPLFDLPHSGTLFGSLCERELADGDPPRAV